MRLENEEGLPWTAATSLSWIVLIVALTSGTALIALSLYLSLWIRSKGRSALPLYGFVLASVACVTELGLKRLHLAPGFASAISLLAVILWFGATYWLRYEIRRHYKETEGWEPQIGPFFTFLFSAIYINYCLNRFDLGSSEHEPPTSLNLSQPRLPIESSKITQ